MTLDTFCISLFYMTFTLFYTHENDAKHLINPRLHHESFTFHLTLLFIKPILHSDRKKTIFKCSTSVRSHYQRTGTFPNFIMYSKTTGCGTIVRSEKGKLTYFKANGTVMRLMLMKTTVLVSLALLTEHR